MTSSNFEFSNIFLPWYKTVTLNAFGSREMVSAMASFRNGIRLAKVVSNLIAKVLLYLPSIVLNVTAYKKRVYLVITFEADSGTTASPSGAVMDSNRKIFDWTPPKSGSGKSARSCQPFVSWKLVSQSLHRFVGGVVEHVEHRSVARPEQLSQFGRPKFTFAISYSSYCQ